MSNHTTTIFTKPFPFLAWLIILISATLLFSSSNAAVVVSASSTSHQKQYMTRAAAPNDDNNGHNYYELKKPMHTTISTSKKMSTTTLPDYLVQYVDSILPKLEQSSSGGSLDTELKRAQDLYKSKYGGTPTYEQEREAYTDFVKEELKKNAGDIGQAAGQAAAPYVVDAASIMCYSAMVPTFCVFIMMWFLLA